MARKSACPVEWLVYFYFCICQAWNVKTSAFPPASALSVGRPEHNQHILTSIIALCQAPPCSSPAIGNQFQSESGAYSVFLNGTHTEWPVSCAASEPLLGLCPTPSCWLTGWALQCSEIQNRWGVSKHKAHTSLSLTYLFICLRWNARQPQISFCCDWSQGTTQTPTAPPSTDWQTGPSLKYHDYI